MNDKTSKSTLENGKQSVGDDSRNKRNSGLFSFFKWLKPSGSASSRESLNSDKANNNSSSCESLSSLQSSGTVASFSFVEPSAYTKNLTEKSIDQAPETDTYKARLKQRDKRREKDKNLTLRKKYNLFFNRDSSIKTVQKFEESTKSLPLMTKPTFKEESKEEGLHRRTNSDSSKIKKAGAYLHVKGKRKAPQPPGSFDDTSNTSLKKTNKRLAPPPPEQRKVIPVNQNSPIVFRRSNVTNEEASIENHMTKHKIDQSSYQKRNSLFQNEEVYASSSVEKSNIIKAAEEHSDRREISVSSFPLLKTADEVKISDVADLDHKNSDVLPHKPEENISDVISNDFLKLDHGILRPVKEDEQNIYSECSPYSSKESTDNSKPWYKRHESNYQLKRDFFNETKEKSVERFPEVSFNRNSIIDLSGSKPKEQKKETKIEVKAEKKKEDKRKSGVSLLPNISELDREAAEILQKEKMRSGEKLKEIPVFMKPKEEDIKMDTDSWVSPKRRSARDLIAKFNAITSVTKVTVNTALFGSSHKKEYFGKSSTKDAKKHQEAMLESHKKRIEMIDKKLSNEKKINIIPLKKSESASVVKKPETPKNERKSWNCPKCYVTNEYWRIICHVCSAIKPYFDDLGASVQSKKIERSYSPTKEPTQNPYERILERSKTQIGFSALTNNYNFNRKLEKSSKLLDDNTDKKEEKEKLKKMLIEMKNSLPKKSSVKNITSRSSIIVEKPEIEFKEVKNIEISDDDTESSDTDNEEVQNDPTNTEYETVEEEKKETNIKQEVATVLIGTKETIYENIKIKKTNDSKPIKVSSSVQTASVISKAPEPSKRVNVTAMVKKKNSFEPMKVKDFEDLYSDQDGKSAARIYANLAQNDELSLFFNMPKNLTEMKNTLSKIKLQNKNKDTIEINRLLRRLEVAIAKGDMTQAADFAKELAQLKVNCSVVRQRSNSSEEKELKTGYFSVDMYVEDKISHRGPFPLEVRPDQTVGELKKQIEKEFEIPTNVQRWILGKELAINDYATLKENNVTNSCAIFLYLVSPDPTCIKLPKASEEKNIDNNEPTTSSMITKLEPTTNQAPNYRETVPKLYPEIDLSITEVYSEKTEATRNSDSPKIIDAIPKLLEPPQRREEHRKTDPVENLTSSSKQNENILDKSVNEKPEKHLFSEVVTQTITTVLHAPNMHLAQPEEIEEYDSKTLKPNSKQSDEWECHLCTLLNPIKSNICGVCATVRQNAPKKMPRKTAPTTPNAPPQLPSSSGQTYLQLVNLDNEDLVHNSEQFECVICFVEVLPNAGVTLRECLHQFCKECLRQTIEFSDDAEVKCPYRDNEYSCNIALQDREIKALVTKNVYDQHLAKSVSQAENQIDKSFHCKTPDCKGWCIFEDNVNDFKCPVCRRVNCLTCQAIHMGLDCKQYQQRMTEESECDENAKQTKDMLDKMVRQGEALKCPTCHVIMMKKWGCDWLRCSMCKTEICWVTRGPRWGPQGKGDTSGGCQCGVNGVKCHPKCNYCH